MIRTTHFIGTLAAALMLALAPLSAAVAEDAASGNDNSQSEAASGEPVTDAQLEKFAAAYGKLQNVRSEYGQKMKQADDDAQRKQLRKEGQQEMVGAIRSAGLDVSEYQRIGKQLNQDKELRSRFQSMVQGHGGGSGNQGGNSD